MPDPLLERDVEKAFWIIVDDDFLRRLDTKLGTVEVVKLLKVPTRGTWDYCGTCDPIDGPYSDGKNDVYWSFHVRRDQKKGYRVSVTRCNRTPVDEPYDSEDVRAGELPWNRIANMATIYACELQRAEGRVHEPVVGEQLVLG